MKVTLAVESLRCTEGSHNKGYQLVKVFIEGAPKCLVTIYGPLGNPNNVQIRGETLTPGGIEEEHFKLLKSKVKKYNRHSPADEYVWVGGEEGWVTEGQKWMTTVLQQHGPWERSFSNDFEDKIDTVVKTIRSLIAAQGDTEVEDLFRTTKQREQREQEKAEAQSLSNWGAF